MIIEQYAPKKVDDEANCETKSQRRFNQGVRSPRDEMEKKNEKDGEDKQE